mgnify:CR=1 FL=1
MPFPPPCQADGKGRKRVPFLPFFMWLLMEKRPAPFPSVAILSRGLQQLRDDLSKLGAPRYILYQSAYDAIVANKADQPKDTKVTIAGKCCESGDLIGENMPLQACEPGDIIAVCATGAYNYSMSSNYNRLQKPAVVFVKDGTSRVVVKRETLEDLVRNDCE